MENSTPTSTGNSQQMTPPLRGDLYDRQLDHLLARTGRYLMTQPALVLTASYLICSLLGLTFVMALFHKFDFAVLPYLEISDFLLIALSHPSTLLDVLLCLLGSVLLFWLDRLMRQTFRRYAVLTDRFYDAAYLKLTIVMLASIPVIFLLYYAVLEAAHISKAIQAGQTPHFQVDLVYPLQDTGKTQRFNDAQVLTRSSSYLFIWHQGQIKVIPHTNIAALLPQPAAAMQQPARETPPPAQQAPSEPAIQPSQQVPASQPLPTKPLANKAVSAG